VGERYQMTRILGRGSFGKVAQAGDLYSCGESVHASKVAQAAAKTHGGKARKLVLEIDNPSKLWSMASKIAQKLCY
jgi:hypothetical protein